jgi:hypothetical protein
VTRPREREDPSGAAEAPVTAIDLDGRRLQVSVHLTFDGVEHLGRLWFRAPDDEESAVVDRAAISGRSRDEVVLLARRFTDHELVLRYRRALATRRRFHRLRETTEELLRRVRYLNHLAVSMRNGTIDVDGAAQEIDVTEQQMHDLVALLRKAAGVEDRRA